MASKQYPFVSLILPIRDEAAYIQRCLDAVFAQDYPAGQMEVLIVDGMSVDGTREIVKEIVGEQEKSDGGHFPSSPPFFVTFLENPDRIVPTALNIGLHRARGEIIIRVDGHCEIAPDYVRKCVRHIQSVGVDGVGGPMETIGETPIAKLIAIAMRSSFGVGNSAFRTMSAKSMAVETVPFPAYTRRIIQRAGMYDEELVRDQDDEYNYRIREIGGRILLAEDVNSKYFSRTSLKSLWRQYYKYGYWKVRVLQKHPRQMRLRQFVPPVFVLALLFSALWAVFLSFHPLSLVIPSLYLFTNLCVSILTAALHKWSTMPLLPVIYAVLHVSYGLGFLVGLVRFAGRWRDRRGNVPLWP